VRSRIETVLHDDYNVDHTTLQVDHTGQDHPAEHCVQPHGPRPPRSVTTAAGDLGSVTRLRWLAAMTGLALGDDARDDCGRQR
jgi:hypothetical protein